MTAIPILQIRRAEGEESGWPIKRISGMARKLSSSGLISRLMKAP